MMFSGFREVLTTSLFPYEVIMYYQVLTDINETLGMLSGACLMLAVTGAVAMVAYILYLIGKDRD